MQIADEHGYTISRSCIHDFDATGPSIVHTGTLKLDPNPYVSVHLTLNISGTVLRDWFMDLDNHHLEERIWGLRITARHQDADPALAEISSWVMPFSDEAVYQDPKEQTEVISGTFEIPLERLFDSADLTADTYVVEVQVLDDAGNASASLAELHITLDEISYPPALLPLVVKR